MKTIVHKWITLQRFRLKVVPVDASIDLAHDSDGIGMEPYGILLIKPGSTIGNKTIMENTRKQLENIRNYLTKWGLFIIIETMSIKIVVMCSSDKRE